MNTCYLDTESIKVLASSQTITKLDISRSFVKLEAAQALEHNNSIVELGAFCCGMEEEKISVLAKNTTITSLDIRLNLETEEISRLMETHTTIVLFYQEPRGSCLSQIAQRNKRNKKLLCHRLASLFAVLFGLKRSQKRRLRPQ